MHHLARSTRQRLNPLAGLLACVVIAGCQATAPASPSAAGRSSVETQTTLPSAPSAAPTLGPTASPTASPSPSPTPGPSPSAPRTTGPTALPAPSRGSGSPSGPTPSCAQRTLARLSWPQRVGQLFLFGIGGTTLAAEEAGAIEANHFGSAWLANNRTDGVAGTRLLTRAIQALAPTATGGVPFFVGADQEGGLVQRLAGPGFSTIPTALAQGGLSTAALRADATAWGSQLAAAGVRLDFAPVMDVVPAGDFSNAPIGELYREFGHDAATVGAHGTAFLEGMRDAGVATTLKHFPGLGRVSGNTDYASTVVDSVTTASDPYLASFRAGIAAGVPFVMISLATYSRIDPNRPAAFSPIVIGELLRGRLGFRGVVVSDSLGAATVAGIDPATRAIDFVAAGGDLIVVRGTSLAPAMALAIRGRAAADPAFRALVDAAALRVLEAKAAYGVLRCP